MTSLIHMGMSKSGSTFLQSNFFDMNDNFYYSGLFYKSKYPNYYSIKELHDLTLMLANQDQFIESTLLTNLNTYNVSLLSTNKWHPSWPINSITSSKIPRLIKMEFTQNNKQYTWIIEPNISYASN